MNERRLKRVVYAAAIYYLVGSNLAIGSLPDNYYRPAVQEAVVEHVVKKPRYGINNSLLSTSQKKYLDEKFAHVKRRYQRTIENVVDSLAINHDFVAALIAAESGGNPLAISNVGAAGLMQLMPETAKAYGLKVFEYHDAKRYTEMLKSAIHGKTYREVVQIDQRFDIRRNILAGVEYLSDIPDDDVMRVVLFNLGGPKLNAIKKRKKKKFGIDVLPRETQGLVQKVHHLYDLE